MPFILFTLEAGQVLLGVLMYTFRFELLGILFVLFSRANRNVFSNILGLRVYYSRKCQLGSGLVVMWP